MKKFIIRWALKQLKNVLKANPNISYEQLWKYGVQDVMEVPATKEKALII